MKKLFFLALMLCSANTVQAQIESDVEIVRSDVRTQKMQILTKAMEFTSDEAAAFWPLYRDYDNAMSAVWDERLSIIKAYAAAYETMTDGVARELMERVFANDAAELAVEREYFEMVAEILPVTKAARFIQVENQLNRMIDTQISAQLPLVPDESTMEEGACGP
jgi:hypothetical protein